MASFGSSSCFSSGSTTHLLIPVPNTAKDVDDVSITGTVSTDLDAERPEDACESHYYGGDMYYSTLVQDYYSKAKLSVNIVRVDEERVSVENILDENRLAEVLQANPAVTFIDLGSGYQNDQRQVTLAAMQIILTRYKVSPLFLEGGPIPHIGGIGFGVQSKIVFSDTAPNVVCGYHVWYGLPLRTSLWSAGSAAALTDDTPTDRERGGYTIIPLSMRLYMTYDHAEKNSVNILYPPHGTDSTATLKKFLSHSDPLGIKDDPFGVHLLYLWRAAIDWRKVLQDITNELMYHELENIAMTQLSGLKKARQLQSLAILIARIGSEMRITLDILRGLQGAHNEFYEIVLKNDSISSRPPIYHRLQSDFRNLAETFNSRLIEVIELDSRIRSCISSLFNMLHLQRCSHGPLRVATI